MAAPMVVILLSTVLAQAAPDANATTGQVPLTSAAEAKRLLEQTERDTARTSTSQPPPQPEKPARKWLWIGLGIAGGALLLAGVTVGIAYAVPQNAADLPGTTGTTVIRFP